MFGHQRWLASVSTHSTLNDQTARSVQANRRYKHKKNQLGKVFLEEGIHLTTEVYLYLYKITLLKFNL